MNAPAAVYTDLMGFSPAPPAPITRADLARSRAFGIRLPDAPRAVEPATVRMTRTVAPTTSIMEVVTQVEPPAPAVAPEGIYSIDTLFSPAPAVEQGCKPDLHPSARIVTPKGVTTDTALSTVADCRALASRQWDGETVALLITRLAIEAIEGPDDASDEIDGLWLDLEPENRQAFRSFLRVFGGGTTGWSAWLASCVQGSPVSFAGPIAKGVANNDIPRPSPRRFAPSWEDIEAAMVLFGPLTEGYQVEGWPIPPLGDRSYPRRKPARVERPTGITDEDVYAPGATS